MFCVFWALGAMLIGTDPPDRVIIYPFCKIGLFAMPPET